jgi:ATP-binding cassette, subfamily B, bacterial
MESPTLAGFASLLRTYLAGMRARVLILAVLLIGGTAAQVSGPLLLGRFVDGAIGGASLNRLYAIGAVFLATTVAAQVLIVAAAYFSERIGWQATNRMRSDLLQHALDLDLAFHHSHSPGEMIERVDGDVTALSNFFSQFVLRILGGTLLLASVLVLAVIQDWRVGLVFAAVIAVTLFALTRARRFAVPLVNAERQASADLYSFVEERLGAVDDIRANGAGSYVMRKYFGVSRDLIFTARRAEIGTASVWTLATALFTASYILVLSLSGYLYRSGELTIGSVYVFFQYMQLLRRPLEQIADQLKELQRAAASIGRVQDLKGFRSTLPPGSVAAGGAGPARLEFVGVEFSYGEAPALSDVSFQLSPGQVLGVLGHTGGGKTTLTRLMLRFYDPQAGTVLLDGVDIRTLRREDLRQRIGMVTQDVQLVSGTVRDNLTLFDRSIADARLVDALRELGLDRWVAALPRGLDTLLGAADSGLSAGEAQLLALGRIFLRNPGLVILDEASSRLDPATEQLTERALSRLFIDRTGVIIAHRLHTLERADSVLVVEHGRVVEYGPRLPLARDPNSRYSSLLGRSGVSA